MTKTKFLIHHCFPNKLIISYYMPFPLLSNAGQLIISFSAKAPEPIIYLRVEENYMKKIL